MKNNSGLAEANYNHLSHTHCWNQESPACGIPLEKHTQCCLCDLKNGGLAELLREFEEALKLFEDTEEIMFHITPLITKAYEAGLRDRILSTDLVSVEDKIDTK
jgi:hypothetical protein